jgi:putative transposase
MEPRKPYPTALSDKEWNLIHHLVPTAKPGGRPENYPTREIVEAIFSILRGGCAWRLLPHDFPPWPRVYQYFWRWRNDGTWHRRHNLLRGDVRVAPGKHRQPSAGLLESQAVKTTEKGGSVGTMPANRSKAASARSASIPSG